jgi:hypothetical protein
MFHGKKSGCIAHFQSHIEIPNFQGLLSLYYRRILNKGTRQVDETTSLDHRNDKYLPDDLDFILDG